MLYAHASDDPSRQTDPAIRADSTSPVGAAVRLAAAHPAGVDLAVLTLDDASIEWGLVAATRPLPERVLRALRTELLTLRNVAMPVCAGLATAYPLFGSTGLLGAAVVLDAGASDEHDDLVLADVLRCATDALESAQAVKARTEATLVEQSARAIRRLFVEGGRAQDVREAGAILAQVAADAFRTERAGMYVVGDDGAIEFAIGVGVAQELSDALAASLTGKIAAKSPVWQTLEQLGGPDLVDDARVAATRPGGFVETMSFASYVAIPLMSTDGPLGMVICGDASQPRVWTGREAELARQFAVEAALIVDAARLRNAQREQLALLSHQAHHDGLTGLANRRLLLSRLDAALDAAGDDGSLTMLLLDLDDFKRVNDTLGHRFGDELLCEVATRLQAALGPRDTLARLGGDEFAAVLPRVHGRQQALEAARLIERALAEPIVLDGVPVNAMTSIGLALFPDHARCAADLLQLADVAMYAAKRARTGAAVYDTSMNDATVERLTLYTELRQAINEGELRLHHQPKIDLRCDRVVGVEALVRWQHPTRGLLGPAEFLPLAESTDLIHPLTAWVVAESLSQRAAWRRSGIDLDVSVNLSAHNLRNGDLLARLRDVIAGEDAPGRLIVEVTETAVMSDPEQSIAALAELRALGVRVSMDDFGTGHSSLALLGQLPVDELKIDRQLVAGAGESNQDRALLDTIVHLGHLLDLQVTAEGVENLGVLAILRDMDCDLGQGYLFAPPMPAEELARFVRGRTATVTTNGHVTSRFDVTRSASPSAPPRSSS